MKKSSFGAIFLEKFTKTEQKKKIWFSVGKLLSFSKTCLSFFGIRLELHIFEMSKKKSDVGKNARQEYLYRRPGLPIVRIYNAVLISDY